MGLNAVQSYPAERVLVAALLGRPASFYELGGRVTEEMFTEPGCAWCSVPLLSWPRAANGSTWRRSRRRCSGSITGFMAS